MKHLLPSKRSATLARMLIAAVFTLVSAVLMLRALGVPQNVHASGITIDEFKALRGGVGITSGPDGNIWMADLSGEIEKMTPKGTVAAVYGALAQGITSGPDGNLWFTPIYSVNNFIGRITTQGVVSEYTVPTSNSNPFGITSGPDGNLWFTERFAHKIGMITPGGSITEYPIPSNGTPFSITAGPDGNLWFAETSGIGKITTSGVITEYLGPGSGAGFEGITTGPDGNLWFTDSSGYIGKITTSGIVTLYQASGFASPPLSIASGSDGRLWYTVYGVNSLYSITTDGVVTAYPISSHNPPYGVTSGPDGNIWFTEYLPPGFTNLIGRVDLTGLTPTPTNTPTPITVTVSVSSPQGHFISSPVQDNAALPLHIHVAYSDGTPVAGALVRLSNPNGFLDVLNPTTDSNGDLDAPLALPPALLLPQSPTAGDFDSEVIATVNGHDYSSGPLPLYHADVLGSQAGTYTQAEAENYTSSVLSHYATEPGFPCPDNVLVVSVICSVVQLLDLTAQVWETNNAYSPQAGDAWTIQVYKFSAPTMTPVYLYYESVARSGGTLYHYARWTEDVTRVQPWLDQPGTVRTALITSFASPVTVLAVSPTGQQVGFDPTSNNFVFDFPAAVPHTGDEPYVLLIPGPVQGQYVYKVTGVGSGTYTMTVLSLDALGNSGPSTIISGVAAPGITDTYLLTSSPSPDQPVVVVRQVAIDIKPGDDPPAINPNSHGVLPVAILSTPTFDATKVSLSSVRFGPANALSVDKHLDIEDVNGDGLPDVVLHFTTNQTGIAADATQACLTGLTVSGASITGCDTLHTVP